MSLSTVREATSSSGSVRTFPEVYASMARRASSPAETPSRRLISRSFFTLLRGTRYCWRIRSLAFADIPNSSALKSHEPQGNHTENPTHTQQHTQYSKFAPFEPASGTNTTIYTIDTTTHQSVWSLPTSGYLALSEYGVLYVVATVSGPTSTTGNVYA